jgi:WD40 repeat protein
LFLPLLALLGAGRPTLGFASDAFSTVSRLIVTTGHKGAILDIESDTDENKLFSSGEDGTVRLWDLESGRLVRVLRVGHNRVSMMAVNPAVPQLAVLDTDGVRSFSVSVWDWSAGQMLFRMSLPEEPLFLRYSGSGSYIALGISRWDGLKIINATDGSSIPFHPEGFGIVRYAEISRTENTIMTYQPNGRIAYWDLATGDPVMEIKSVPLLSQIRITEDRRSIVGTTDSDILLVDLLSGAVKARAALTGVTSLDISAGGDRVACVAGGDQGSVLSMWDISGDSFRREAAIPSGDEPFQPALVCFAGDLLLAGDDHGGIYSLPNSGTPLLLARDELVEVTGIAMNGNTLALASDERLWLFPRPAIGGSHVVSAPVILNNPLKAQSGLSFLEDGRLLIWSKAGEKGAYTILNRREGSFKPGFAGFTAPLLQALAQGGLLVTLEKGGTVRIIDLASGNQRFTAWFPGLTSIVRVSDTRLVGGRSVAAEVDGSLLSIDFGTGETVALSTHNIYTYELSFDPARKILYSLGVDSDGRSNLMANGGKNLEKRTSIASYDGEDLSASLALDPTTGVLYSSLGYDGITTWDGSSSSSLSSDATDGGATSRKLVVWGGLLCSLNGDSTVTLWDSSAREVIGTMYLFLDEEWCLLFPDGTFEASDGGVRHVDVYTDDIRELDKEPYREMP